MDKKEYNAQEVQHILFSNEYSTFYESSSSNEDKLMPCASKSKHHKIKYQLTQKMPHSRKVWIANILLLWNHQSSRTLPVRHITPLDPQTLVLSASEVKHNVQRDYNHDNVSGISQLSFWILTTEALLNLKYKTKRETNCLREDSLSYLLLLCLLKLKRS